MKQFDVLTIGEALVDFIPLDGSLNHQFHSSVGGAPLNVAIGIAKLGGRTAMVGRVGTDPLGEEILTTLRQYGVDCSMMQLDRERHTTITLVMPKNSDMQRYLIYRDADCALDCSQLPAELFSRTRLVHVGVLLNVMPAASSQISMLLQTAKACGAEISLDVNMRPGCWRDASDMIRESRCLAEMADIIKVTVEEMKMMDLPVQQYSADGKIILVTDGDRDIHAFWNRHEFVMPVKKVPVRDVTGAGDAFLAAFLYAYSRSDTKNMELIARCVEAGMCAGSFSIQRTGAHPSYPTYADIFEKEVE